MSGLNSSAAREFRHTVQDDLLHPGSGGAGARRSTDLIFYDPISSMNSAEQTRGHVGGTTTMTHLSKQQQTHTVRSKAIEGVVRELARLSAMKHGHDKSG